MAHLVALRLGLASKLRRIPVDVILARRYEHGRDGFVARLEAWGEDKAEEWRVALEARSEQLSRQRDDFVASLRAGQTALREQLLSAEAGLDEKLAELKARRQALADAYRDAKEQASSELRRELKHLKRSVREAQRSARAALKSWERLAREYALIEALPSPA